MLSHLATQLLVAFNITGPILLILSLGLVFRRIGLLNEEFVRIGNKLVFNVTLPCLLFLSTATRPIQQSLNAPLVLFAAACTVGAVVLLWLLAPLFVDRDRRGVFTQSAFRGNMGIVGLALCVNAYGDQILAKAGVYMALMTILYNLLATLILAKDKTKGILSIWQNPLIIGVCLGLGWSTLSLPLPEFVEQSGRYFAQMTLPLALLCIGASLRWQSFKTNSKDVMWATGFKLVVVPALVTLLAIWQGYRDEDLGVFFLMMAAPTAVAAFVMARQMTSHGHLAAESVAVSTALSPFTVTAGLLLLGLANLI